MFSKLLKSFFGSSSDRAIRRLNRIVGKINKVEDKYKKHLEWLRPLDSLTRATKGYESGLDYMMRRDNSKDLQNLANSLGQFNSSLKQFGNGKTEIQLTKSDADFCMMIIEEDLEIRELDQEFINFIKSRHSSSCECKLCNSSELLLLPLLLYPLLLFVL